MKAKKFESDFDTGRDVTAALDVSRARRPVREPAASGDLSPAHDQVDVAVEHVEQGDELLH